MTTRDITLFQFAPLDGYSLKERISIYAADLIFYLLIRVIGATVRFRVSGWENVDSIKAAGRSPVYCFWHDRIFLSAYFWRDRDIVVLTSRSFDGEYIARFIQRFGYGAIRGSSSRGGARALVEMVRSMKAGYPMAFTVDGPRGPRHVAKPGPVMLAKKTGNPMLPFVITPDRFWTIRSWDRMQIPKPFSRARLVLGEPIYVDAEASEAEMDAALQALQTALDRLNNESAVISP